MVDRPKRARRTRAPLSTPATTPKPIGPLTLPKPPGDGAIESMDDGSLRMRGSATVENLLRFVSDVAAMVEAGTLEAPASVEVGFKDEASKIARGPAATPAEFARTITRFATAALTAPGALYFAFALDCGCGVRVEVARGA